MPTIRIDDELYEFLKVEAEPFVDTPNSVLRRLVGLPARNGSDVERSDDGVSGRPSGTSSRVPGLRKTKRRKGGRSSAAKRARARAPKGTLLAAVEYEMPILQILVERGGDAPASDVLDSLEARLDGKFTDVDRERLASGGVRWRNRAQFVRLDLVNRGEMASDSPRGMWAVTDAGRSRAKGA